MPQAFKEYALCLEEVYRKAFDILRYPDTGPLEFKIEVGGLPQDFLSPARNIFSSLFQSVYHILGIDERRRMLYGKLNHLFRVWVTSADNLLDSEDKIVIPLSMKGNSRTMRQVLSIMAADRVLARLLDEAREEGVVSSAQAELLSRLSLEVLLPSAAEEASEEGGITDRPEPSYILQTIHRLKTGLLFHIPFLGPENIESRVDETLLHRCKYALDKFGLGCQLLDDIRDIARDYLERRHNYVLSKMRWDNKTAYLDFLEQARDGLNSSSNIFSYFPETVCPAAELAIDLLSEGMRVLDICGLAAGGHRVSAMAFSMFKVLGVEEALELKEAVPL